MRRFLGIVQYSCAICHKRNHLIDPMTNLVGKTGQTQVVKANGTKKKAWYWNSVHQEVVENIKLTWLVNLFRISSIWGTI